MEIVVSFLLIKILIPNGEERFLEILFWRCRILRLVNVFQSLKSKKNKGVETKMQETPYVVHTFRKINDSSAPLRPGTKIPRTGSFIVVRTAMSGVRTSNRGRSGFRWLFDKVPGNKYADCSEEEKQLLSRYNAIEDNEILDEAFVLGCRQRYGRRGIRAHDIANKKDVIIKCVEVDEGIPAATLREITILRSLNNNKNRSCENILLLEDFIYSESISSYYCIFEFMGSGSLRECILRKGKAASVATAAL